MEETRWQKEFDEACQDILEDAFLMDALSLYVINNGSFMHGERGKYFPQVFYRLSDYLSQHALDLHNLQKRLEQESCFRYSAT